MPIDQDRAVLHIIELLTELRQDLRRELNLEKVDTPIKVFRNGLPPLS